MSNVGKVVLALSLLLLPATIVADCNANENPNTLEVGVHNLFWWNLFRQRGGGNFFNVWKREGPYDVMMFQECDNINEVLQRGGFCGWEGSQGHAVAVAYNTRRFRKTDEGEVAVAEDRREQYYGKRYCRFLRLEDRKSGQNFLFVSFHGPLPVNTGGKTGGAEVGRSIVRLMQSKSRAGDTIVLGGDFNSGYNTAMPNEIAKYYKRLGGDWVDHVFSNMVGVSPNVSFKIIHGTGSDHRAMKATFVLAGDHSPVVPGPSDPVPAPLPSSYPECDARTKWVAANWRKDPKFARGGVDGSTASIHRFLYNENKYCPLPKTPSPTPRPTPRPTPSTANYPECDARTKWVAANWRKYPKFARGGVDGSTASIHRFLYNENKYCPLPTSQLAVADDAETLLAL